ncbi:MAG: ketoacyl-ACP synthase III [Candidatus Omnitrophica bacterium]|nr:ketoacyl-ACP synthase III [Candidatus Omnitrophota bacterium]MBU1995913.1 ketoacyl-ACP synthase III [Candidatus Omnitrophota bacterium]MBU4334023.1 ketoacyl-ACP synthase III [Candidatus Omnitrophota bacterium]
MTNIAISSLGHYLPKKILTNADLEKLVDTSDEWITTRTGIKERRIALKDEKTSDMAIGAAKEALKNAKLEGSKIELIIVATTTPDSCFPSVGNIVQNAIGAHHAAAFDVSAACAGFLYALTTAKQYLVSGMYKNALVIAADKFTNLLDWNDRQTCVLFGDGAGAVVLKPTKAKKGILSDYLLSLGKYQHVMYVATEKRKPLDKENTKIHFPYAVMHGQELFKVAVNSMAEAVKIVVERAGLEMSDIDCVVPHQANDRIITAIAKKLKVPKEKFFINIHKYGNMSAASVAVALYEAVEEKKIKKGSNVVLVTFGAGLVAAANVVKF